MRNSDIGLLAVLVVAGATVLMMLSLAIRGTEPKVVRDTMTVTVEKHHYHTTTDTVIPNLDAIKRAVRNLRKTLPQRHHPSYRRSLDRIDALLPEEQP